MIFWFTFYKFWIISVEILLNFYHEKCVFFLLKTTNYKQNFSPFKNKWYQQHYPFLFCDFLGGFYSLWKIIIQRWNEHTVKKNQIHTISMLLLFFFSFNWFFVLQITYLFSLLYKLDYISYINTNIPRNILSWDINLLNITNKL